MTVQPPSACKYVHLHTQMHPHIGTHTQMSHRCNVQCASPAKARAWQQLLYGQSVVPGTVLSVPSSWSLQSVWETDIKRIITQILFNYSCYNASKEKVQKHRSQ